MTRLHLNAAVWTLTGWQPHNWDMLTTMETGVSNRIEVGPLPITVPGSVQQALRDAEVIPDWRDGLQARTCEWVENRHWVLETSIPAGAWSAMGPLPSEASGSFRGAWTGSELVLATATFHAITLFQNSLTSPGDPNRDPSVAIEAGRLVDSRS